MVVGEGTIETQVAVIGGGPGGYSAAFRAADLGLDVTLIDVEERPGGVCLYRGCIPSKVLLHAANLVSDAQRSQEIGIDFGEPSVDLRRLRGRMDQVIDKLTNGLLTLAKKRDVQLVQGRASFSSSRELRVSGSPGTRVSFEHVIVATGSRPIALPGTRFQDESRLMSSKGALALRDLPERLLVVGAGDLGMGLGMAYAALGSKVSVVEREAEILGAVDRDLVRPLERRAKQRFDKVYLETEVEDLTEEEDAVRVRLGGRSGSDEQTYDRVLVTIGREPNSSDLGFEDTAVELDDRGFITVDERQRTADGRIYAVGDVTGGRMLADEAIYEGKVAAEAIAGKPVAFDARAVPWVIWTDPEIASAGLTETEARSQEREIQVARFTWQASGRAVAKGIPDGLTKIVFDPDSGRVLGVGIVGRGAAELIAEGALAVEMGAVATDLDLTIHPHPTLSESLSEAAAVFLGHPIHVLGS